MAFNRGAFSVNECNRLFTPMMEALMSLEAKGSDMPRWERKGVSEAMRFWFRMARLTKVAIFVTCASPLVLYLTSASQALVSDGQNVICIISWNIGPFGRVHMPHSSWWVFVNIWLACLLIPPMLWVAVGLTSLASKLNPSRPNCC
jgi:hypothetical protein